MSSGRSRTLKSSGKRSLDAEKADRYETLSRKRRSSRVGSSTSKPIVISDDEKEDQAETGCPSGSKCRSPTGYDDLSPFVQPLAVIAPGQERVDPDPNTRGGVLQRLDNALKQIISIIGVKWGTYAAFRPFLASCLEDVRRVGGVQLSLRCDLKLTRWGRLALRAEKLAFFEPRDEIQRLMGEAQARIMVERKVRAQQVLEQEAIAADLCERQGRLQRAMDAYGCSAVCVDVDPPQKWSYLSTEVHRAYKKAMHTLYQLQREDNASIAALSKERLEKEAKAQVQAKWEKEVAELKTELDSFTVLDCA